MADVNVKRTSSILFVLRMIRMLMSLITVTLTAKYFGVSVEKDAWLLVYTLLSSIVLLLWGPINETFRAKFIFIRESDGEELALRSASSLVSGIVLITLVVIAVLAVSAAPISKFSAVDLGASGIAWFMSLFLALLPTLLIDELNNISSSILNAYNIFYLPEIVGTITGVVYIGILIWIAPAIGIYSMVIGQYVSTIALTIVLLVFLRRNKLFRAEWLLAPRMALVKPFVWYALPFFFPYAIGQINNFSERWLAGILGVGNISILDYGRRFTVILQGVISGILTTVFVPVLAKAHINNDRNAFVSGIIEHLSVVYGIMLLAVPLLFGAAQPLCDFLYHRGTVSAEDISRITLICRLYAAAFMLVMIYIVFGNVLLASNQGKLYAFWGVIAQVLVIAANFGLVKVFGLIVFPITLGLSHLIVGMIMWKKGNAWIGDIAKRLVKYNCVVIGLSATIYLVSQYLISPHPVLNLCISCAIIVALSVFLAPIIDLNIWTQVKRLLRR